MLNGASRNHLGESVPFNHQSDLEIPASNTPHDSDAIFEHDFDFHAFIHGN
jgi:hypothetical protein